MYKKKENRQTKNEIKHRKWTEVNTEQRIWRWTYTSGRQPAAGCRRLHCFGWRCIFVFVCAAAAQVPCVDRQLHAVSLRCDIRGKLHAQQTRIMHASWRYSIFLKMYTLLYM